MKNNEKIIEITDKIEVSDFLNDIKEKYENKNYKKLTSALCFLKDKDGDTLISGYGNQEEMVILIFDIVKQYAPEVLSTIIKQVITEEEDGTEVN